MPYKDKGIARERRKELAKANRKKISAYWLKYYHENKEKVRCIQKEYEKRNEEKIKLKKQIYRQTEIYKVRRRVAPEYRQQKKYLSKVEAKIALREQKLRYKLRKRMQTVGKINLLKLLEESKGYCSICKKPIVDKYHIDHIIPLSKNGLHEQSNLQITHPFCNISKGNKINETL